MRLFKILRKLNDWWCEYRRAHPRPMTPDEALRMATIAHRMYPDDEAARQRWINKYLGIEEANEPVSV